MTFDEFMGTYQDYFNMSSISVTAIHKYLEKQNDIRQTV